MNRINQLFDKKKNNILSIYFTAGHPEKDSVKDILISLESNGVDMVEIGMPFSDPLADGPVIQKSSQKALENGMNLSLLFEQLKDIRNDVSIPLVLMGYINPVFQYGLEKFLKKCQEVGVDGIILPDLPVDLYLSDYKDLFEKYDIHYICLITPQTSDERIKLIDKSSNGFIYMVSSASTTGARQDIESRQIEYFERINSMNLETPRLIGFGISNKQSYNRACNYAHGVIIGSAFVNAIGDTLNYSEAIKKFISSIKD